MIEGKEELKLSDIKVEWDSGGIERDSSALSAEIDDILALYSKKG